MKPWTSKGDKSLIKQIDDKKLPVILIPDSYQPSWQTHSITNLKISN